MALNRAWGLPRIAAVVAVLALPVAIAGTVPSSAQTQAQPPTFSPLAARLVDAVVNITSYQLLTPEDRAAIPPGTPLDNFLGPNGEPIQRARGVGSGFVTDASGLLVTNFHVIDQADRIYATFHDGTELIAEVVGIDQATDIAVLRVNPPRPLTAVPFGDSEAMSVGDWVMAIGNPFNFGGTVTVGIISARNRDLEAGPYDDYIQTDAAINTGNSGGPLFNMAGEVIGINAAIFSQTNNNAGVAFAIPAVIAARVVGQIVEFGYVKRGRMGIRIQTVTDGLAEGFGLDRPRGALVAEVYPNTPAEAAGMQLGDIVLAVAGRPVEEMRDLPRIVSNIDIGTVSPVVVLRGGQEVTLEVAVQEVPPDPATIRATVPEPLVAAAPAATASGLGLIVAEITPDLRAALGIPPNFNGVLVMGVQPQSLASERPIQQGDIIVEVGNDPLHTGVRTPADVNARLAEAVALGRRVALFLLMGPDGTTRYEWIRLGQ